jgi:hypothetical protein
LAAGGEPAGRPPRFFRAFPSTAAVVEAARFLLLIFLVRAVLGEVAVAPASASAAARTATFLSVASWCLAKPTRFGVTILKTRTLGLFETH